MVPRPYPDNELVRRMRAAGLHASALAERAGLPSTWVGLLLRGKVDPLRWGVAWRNSVLGVAGVLGCDTEDLYHDIVVPSALVPTPYSDGNPVEAVWRAIELERLLSTLRPRTRRIVEGRLGNSTLQEVGDVIGITRERVRGIAAKAARQMKGRLRQMESGARPDE